ncbi:MAG TPA: peptidylprolyl isomerase [Acidobacteriota bacterium]|nr:peptidylprolyl isomerase [Acidobacteriota bacterium]
MKVLIADLGIVVSLFLVSTGVGHAQSSPQKTPPKSSTAPAQAAKEAAKEPEEVIPSPGPDALFPAVVARVNGKAVLGRDLEQRIQAELATIGSPAWKNLREDYRQQLTGQSLGSLIANELLYQRATEAGIKASDTEVQVEFAKVAKTFASDAEMNMQLANRGLDRAALNKELARSLVVAKYVQENITKKIVVSPVDAQQYYSAHTEEFRHPDLVRTSHILILVPAAATEDQNRTARQRAEALLERARKGEDFAKLAKENSMDGSASQGGDIGFVPKGRLAPEYEQAAFSLPVGGISDVVRTQFGYHVIKVTEIKKEGISTLDEIRSDLIEFMKNQRAQSELGKHVSDLQTKAKIEIYIPVGTPQAPGAATTSSPRP